MVEYQSKVALQGLFGFREVSFFRDSFDLLNLWWYSFLLHGSVMGFKLFNSERTHSFCHFSCFWTESNTARVFPVRVMAPLTASTKSFMYWAHWLALVTGTKCSRIKFENSDLADKALCSFPLEKGSVSKLKNQHRNRPLEHLEELVCFVTIRFPEKPFPCHAMCYVWQIS